MTRVFKTLAAVGAASTLGLLLMGFTGYAPRAFTKYTTTKSLKYSVKGKRAITVLSSATASAYLNGTGADWPLAANTAQDLPIFGNVSTVTFTNTSTAAPGVTYRFQEM